MWIRHAPLIMESVYELLPIFTWSFLSFSCSSAAFCFSIFFLTPESSDVIWSTRPRITNLHSGVFVNLKKQKDKSYTYIHLDTIYPNPSFSNSDFSLSQQLPKYKIVFKFSLISDSSCLTVWYSFFILNSSCLTVIVYRCYIRLK